MKTTFLYSSQQFYFFSCQKELSLENGTGSGNSGGTGGGTGGGTNTGDCKACIYIPMCGGAWYTYNDTILGTSQIATDTLKYAKDTTINNLTFKKFLSATSQSNTYTNCTDGVTRVNAYNSTTLGGQYCN